MDGDPPVQAHEIIWKTPSGLTVRNGSRFSMLNRGRTLLVHIVGLGEFGQFQVDIANELFQGVYHVVASTIVAATVSGKLL